MKIPDFSISSLKVLSSLLSKEDFRPWNLIRIPYTTHAESQEKE